MQSERSPFRLSGIRLMCQASLAFSLMVLGVKGASQTLPPFEIVFFRSVMGTLMLTALMWRKRISFFGGRGQRNLLLLRGTSGFLAVTLHFYTIAVLPLGTAVMLNYTAIIFVALFAILFLGEKLGKFLAWMILVSFLGMYLLVHPKPTEDLLLLVTEGVAVFLGILSAVFAALAVLTIRKVGSKESPLTVIFYFTGMATVGSAFLLPFGFVWPADWKVWLALLAIGIGSFYGQLWMTIAYRRAPATLVAPFSYVTPLLAFVYGVCFWKEMPTAANLVGVVMIVLGGTLISIVEARQGRKFPAQVT